MKKNRDSQTGNQVSNLKEIGNTRFFNGKFGLFNYKKDEFVEKGIFFDKCNDDMTTGDPLNYSKKGQRHCCSFTFKPAPNYGFKVKLTA